MERRLYKRFLKQRDRNIPINGVVFKAKAKYLFEKYKRDGKSLRIGMEFDY